MVGIFSNSLEYIMKKITIALITFYLICEIHCFDKNLTISKLAGCRELLLDTKNDNSKNFAISSFINNPVEDNELIRMKFYAIGYDFYFYFKYSEVATQQFVACINGYERRNCSIQSFIDGKQDLKVVPCQNLTNEFYYTEFNLVITKSKL